MSVLTNKHVVVSLIVTPILAILGYFAVDAMVSEKPHVAVSGSRYELAEKPNCRYNSGVCGLKNGDFELKLTTEWSNEENAELTIRSIFPLQGAKVALVKYKDGAGVPQAMISRDEMGLLWSVELPHPDPNQDRLQLVVSSNNTLYFADAALKFSIYKTSFGEDFRR